jgi:hypothetical protein
MSKKIMSMRFKLARLPGVPNDEVGHMTGRQLQRRPGYEINMEKVLQACARNDVAVEINAHPWRLDLDWRWHQAALDFGCMMSINPDAHSVPELDYMHWGVALGCSSIQTKSDQRAMPITLRQQEPVGVGALLVRTAMSASRR